MNTAAPERVKGVCCELPGRMDQRRVARSVELAKALADPTRLQMLGVLKRSAGPVCICDFTASFELSQPTISHHMGKLKEAGLVEVSRAGIWAYYRLAGQLDPTAKALLQALV